MTEADERECPFCKELIKASAVKCRYCRSSVTPDLPDHGGTCPFCKEAVKTDAITCRYCGSSIGPGSRAPGFSALAEDLVKFALLRRRPGSGLGGTVPGEDCAEDCLVRLINCSKSVAQCDEDYRNCIDGCLPGGGGSFPVILLRQMLRQGEASRASSR
jgi:hypothetical protein